MNTVIWIVQVIMFIKFLSIAYSHGLQRNNTKMEQSKNKFGKHSNRIHKIIAGIIFLGSIGIIIPAIIGKNNSITIISGIVLAVMTMISIIFHIRSREKPIILADIILILLLMFVTYGRLVISPL
jgi:uncharacterized membrane protein